MKYLLKCQYWNCQLLISLTLIAYTHQMLYKSMMIIYLFHESKICSTTMFIVNSLHMSWNLNATSTLCQSTLSNLWHSNSCDFSPYVIFAVKWHRICDLIVAMIDKTSSGFNMCHHKNSLPYTVILYRLYENLSEC